MEKYMEITYEDKTYKLMFTRRTAARLADSGFKLEDIEASPLTAIPSLVHGAFLAKQPLTKRETTEEIFKSISKKDEFILALAELYVAPVEAYLSEPEETEKNAAWEMVK